MTTSELAQYVSTGAGLYMGFWVLGFYFSTMRAAVMLAANPD